MRSSLRTDHGVRKLTALGLLVLLAVGLSACGKALVSEEDDNETLSKTASGITCGSERWSVKTGTDSTAGQINLSPQDNTIVALRGATAPNPIPLDTRVAPIETQAWRLTNVTLVEYKQENDSDYHLVLKDANGNTMIAEIPAPGCTGSGSPLASGIQTARTTFNAHHTVSGSFQQANETVTLVGVGFFDFLHGQTGVAPNGIELHPVVGICFGANCSTGGGGGSDFTVAASPSSVTAAPGSTATYAVSTSVSSGSAQTIALSVSGLPAGASATFNPASVQAGASSTLTVAIPAAAAASTSTLTVTGSAGALSHTSQVQLQVASGGGGGGGGGGSTIANGDFETGDLTGWTGSGHHVGVSSTAHGGSFSAQIGDTNAFNGSSSLTQQLVVPSAGGTLSFWYQPHCPDTLQYDQIQAQLRTSSGQIAANLLNVCADSSSWVQVTRDLTSFAGQTLTLWFNAHDDGYPGDSTYFLLDDVAFAPNGGGDTQPPVVSFSAPANGSTLSGSVTVSASATDNVGVSRVELDADGVQLVSLNGASASTSWNTAGVANGSHTLTAKAYDAAGNVGTATLSVTVSNASSGTPLVNGDFEQGTLNGWTSSGIATVVSTAHGGTHAAQLGNSSPSTNSSLTQSFTVPSGSSSLSFWYRVTCPDTVSYDWATVVVKNASGTVVGTPLAKTCTNDGTWRQASFDLTPFAGQTVTLVLQNHDDNYSGDATYTLYDDVAVSGSGGGGDTTPPTVSLTAPASGATVSGTTSLSASASDNVGVTRVDFLVDGVQVGSDTATPYSYSWSSSSVANGSHAIAARAWDAAGNSTTSTAVNVQVSNGSSHAIHTVFVIVMENHNWSSIKGSGSAPYINNTLLPMAARAEQYYNPPGNHPSEPNYLWMEAGTNFGVTTDSDPSVNHQSTTQHLVTLLENAGVSWKSYQEGISGTTCPLTSSGLYAPKHNPMVFFDDVTNTNSTSAQRCIQHVRPYSELQTDLNNGTVAAYNFITPNLCDDMHNSTGCATTDSVKNGDTWLSTEVPKILNSAAYRNGGALFITWDESEGGDYPIGMIVLSPYAKQATGGYSNSIHYTHGSLLRTNEEIFGVGPMLGDAANQSDLSDLFGTFP